MDGLPYRHLGAIAEPVVSSANQGDRPHECYDNWPGSSKERFSSSWR